MAVSPSKAKAHLRKGVVGGRSHRTRRSFQSYIHGMDNFKVRMALERKGVGQACFHAATHFLGVTQQEMVRNLNLSNRNLQRQKEKLSFENATKTIRLLRVLKEALKVIGNEKSAKAWILEPNPSLAQKSPLSYLDTQAGEELVLETLGRVYWGIYA